MINVKQRREKDYICWDIFITRGDSGYIDLDPTDFNGKEIILGEGDSICCQVRKAPNGGELLFTGSVEKEDTGIVWHIQPEDTEEAPEDYYFWDSKIVFSNGDVFTWIPTSRFILLPKVTEVEESE